jgi:phosphonoacetaldehyde hydrolase
MITAVILDWAGTTVDYGSLAPVAAMERLFSSVGVDVSTAEIRASMGLHKKEHIRAIASPRGLDTDALYAAFIPTQMDVLAAYSDVIAGVSEAVDRMRGRGIKIGSTTGYNRTMLDFVREHAARQGYVPDCALSPDDVGGGRPMPWMCYAAAVRLGVYPFWTMVKVGDTPSDIAEGRNAGMWTVGVTRTGNEVGLSEAQWSALTADTRARLLDVARGRLRGADYVIETVAEIDEVLDAITVRLARGDHPSPRPLQRI